MRVFGGETEYGLSARVRLVTGRWRRLASDEAAQRLFAPIVAEHASTNVFLRNGGRLYLDVGSHPEYATAECTTLRRLLVHERAGDAMLVRLAGTAMEQDEDEAELRLVKNNADGHGNTYGSHENYLVERDLDYDVLTEAMVPFLVTRQLVCGAGAWRGGRLVFGQRSAFLHGLVSPDTTKSRPLINTRDEPLADPTRWRRLHVIAGDSNLAEGSLALKWGTTLAVLDRCEDDLRHGRVPFRHLALADPSGAIVAASLDPHAHLERRGGGTITPVQIQEAYREAVHDAGAPTERAWVLGAWGRVLGALAAGRPDDIADLVDWAAKRAMIERFRDRHQLAPDAPELAALDLACHELEERDGRPVGLLRLMEARGELLRLSRPGEVEAALAEPPDDTRALLRARLIGTARARGREHVVDWASFAVRDLPGGEVRLPLPDPLAVADAAVDELCARMEEEPRTHGLRGSGVG